MRVHFGLSAVAAVVSLGVAARAQSAPQPPPQAPAQPATAPAPPPATEVGDVSITAQRAEAVKAFVAAMATPDRFQDQVARWDKQICSTVIGLPAKHAQYMNDRLALNAIAVGLTPGDAHCQPNILILVAPDADKFTAEIVKRHGSAFAKYNDVAGVSTRGRKALKQWVETPQPVRWWHVSQVASSDGILASDGTLRIHRGFRLKPDTHLLFGRVIIIVDADRAQGVSYQALCDYISMVALAQVNPRIDPMPVPSILNLFVDRDAGRPLPGGLTEWDHGYLEGLYHADQDARDLKHQNEQITEDMKKRAAKPK